MVVGVGVIGVDDLDVPREGGPTVYTVGWMENDVDLEGVMTGSRAKSSKDSVRRGGNFLDNLRRTSNSGRCGASGVGV